MQNISGSFLEQRRNETSFLYSPIPNRQLITPPTSPFVKDKSFDQKQNQPIERKSSSHFQFFDAKNSSFKSPSVNKDTDFQRIQENNNSNNNKQKQQYNILDESEITNRLNEFINQFGNNQNLKQKLYTPQTERNSLMLEYQKSFSNQVPLNSQKILQKNHFCNCKKSKCLKLYCECFANGEICNDQCNCVDCQNNVSSQSVRNYAIENILTRDPEAFNSKFHLTERENGPIHKRGCNCKKSNCLKRYCECYNQGIKCSSYCKCVDCKNTGEVHSNKIFIDDLMINRNTSQKEDEIYKNYQSPTKIRINNQKQSIDFLDLDQGNISKKLKLLDEQ